MYIPTILHVSFDDISFEKGNKYLSINDFIDRKPFLEILGKLDKLPHEICSLIVSYLWGISINFSYILIEYS